MASTASTTTSSVTHKSALTHCQACGSESLESFYSLPSVPVHSCLMVKSREDALAFPSGELNVAVCHDCGFIQNRKYDPTLQNYSPEYEETQGFSGTFRKFQTELCQDQVARYGLGDKLVLEIGCGKGEFLTELCEISGGRGIGIDPGYRPERNTSEAASRIEFRNEFYAPEHASLRADYIACRHTLEHIGDVKGFMEIVAKSVEGRDDAILCFELPGTERILEERAFWDIYYEHCSYFTLGSLARLFRRHGFQLLDLYKGYDDQYLLIEARTGDPSLGRCFPAEDDLAETLRSVEDFKSAIQTKFDSLRADLAEAAARGPVLLWGSGSKAVSYLTTLGIGDEVTAVVDINPHKHGKFLAGTGHEIVAPDALKEVQPAHVLIMNAIYVDEITRDIHAMGLAPTIAAL
ncbi:hypothetical protein Poly30_45560 [Planctomycetes bacterium Poly30]|uniref:C-methyltransferase domain-containing protein n=1 Tax=Saltatorellus ferox TaxID=2528018 RepID=A0A518EY31_9BACT|nr:hypothetical protein Poly30_45560 [Planctomycetes bacterium Poly30]